MDASATQSGGSSPEDLLKQPGRRATDTIWIIVVTGLVGLLFLALGGLIYLLAEGKTTDVLVTAFTGLLAGLLGLFAPSPAGSGGG